MKRNTISRLWNEFLNIFPSKCTDCGKEMKRNDRVLMATCSGAGIGVYYKGKGICHKCLDKRFDEALDDVAFDAVND